MRVRFTDLRLFHEYSSFFPLEDRDRVGFLMDGDYHLFVVQTPTPPHPPVSVCVCLCLSVSVSLSLSPHRHAYFLEKVYLAEIAATAGIKTTTTCFPNTEVTFCACCSALMRRQRPETHTISKSTLPRGCIDRGKDLLAL